MTGFIARAMAAHGKALQEMPSIALPARVTMALWSDTKFPSSITLDAAEWRMVIAALKAHRQVRLAEKVADQIGRRPE